MDEALDELVGARAFAAARGMLGVRFRLQGSDPATGLDCVGLVWAAYAAAGVRLARPEDYPLRGWARARVEGELVAAGFAPAGDGARVGDVALIAFAAGQFHLALIGPASVVHAHAGLRRVVETVLDEAVRDAVRWRLLGGKRTLLSPPACGRGRGWAATSQWPTPLRLANKFASLAAPPAGGRGDQLSPSTSTPARKKSIFQGA